MFDQNSDHSSLTATAAEVARPPKALATDFVSACAGEATGREAFVAGRVPRKFYSADPSSPEQGLIQSTNPQTVPAS